MALTDEINKDYQYCFKTVSMKRRLLVPIAGEYFETDWLDVSDYVLDISAITWNIDDAELNEFTQGDFTLTLVSRLQEFSPETNPGSFFSGYLTRHKTKIKISAGYTDIETGTSYSYDVGVGFINADEINIESDSTITIPCINPTMIFDEQTAEDINDGTLAGGTVTTETDFRLRDAAASFDEHYIDLEVTNVTTGESTKITNYVDGTQLMLQDDIFSLGDVYSFEGQIRWWRSQTITQLVQKLYDLQKDTNYVFHPFLDGSSISPGNDITVDLADFTGMTCREALGKLAEISNSCWYINGDWELVFRDREPAGASVYSFTNQGMYVNILGASAYNDGLKKVKNRATWKDTLPLLIVEETGWQIGDDSSSWKYGVREYEFDNPFITDSTLQTTICTAFLQEFSISREEIILHTKFIPHLELLDPVTVTYVGVAAKNPGYFWNKFYWNKGYWTGRIGGIQIQERAMKIIKLVYNVMDFTCDFKMRGV